MTIEEKSKAYDEALERARKLYERGTITESLGYVFPELAESEDERVRKEIIDYHRSMAAQADDYVHEAWIAWLERQGEQKYIPKYKIGDYVKNTNYKGEPIYEIVYMDKECYICEYRGKERMGDKAVMHFSFDNPYLRLVQKPTDKVEPKFNVGDWVFIEEVKGYKNGPFQIKTVDSFGYNFDEYHTIPFMYEELLSKWTIKNAKPGDVLQLGSVTAIFQKYIGNGNCKCYCSVYNGELEIPSQDGTDDSYGCCNAVLATKEQCDLLFQKMHDAGYEWDAERKELKKIDARENLSLDGDLMEADCSLVEQKPALSEEDKDILNFIITRLHSHPNIKFDEYKKEYNWLKSLKERFKNKL